MILADTSVWIDHFRNGNEKLNSYLNQNKVCMHPFVIGELACGSIANRWETFGYFKTLPHVEVASYEEILTFIDMHKLYSIGVGYVDAHLLAAAKLSGIQIWTLDRRLKSAAEVLLLAADA